MSPGIRGNWVSSMRIPTVKPNWLKPPRTRPVVMRPTVLQGPRPVYTPRRDRGHREVPRADGPGTHGREGAADQPHAGGRRLGRPAASHSALRLLQRAVSGTVPGPGPGPGLPGGARLAGGAGGRRAVVRLAR